jgi:F-type H+-transporting ATPase subunit delta
MAEVATIARPYAEAAFGLADAAGALPQWSAALGRLAQAMASREVNQLLGDPKISPAQLTDLLLAVGGDSTAEMQNFVAALVESKRVPALASVRDIFETLKNEREGTVDAKIESAFPLDDAQLASLVGDLERRFARKILAEVNVDKELIGGVRVSVGDEVIDGSVRGKLAAMATALKN